MCEVGAKTANVARHALVNALQICETEKIKKITRGRRNSNQLGGKWEGGWATRIYQSHLVLSLSLTGAAYSTLILIALG